MQLEINTIKVGPRIRKDFGDIDELASSLSRLGQLQPIVVDPENHLLAGGRRLAAAMQLGWSHIEAVSITDLDPVTKREVELEENLRRKDLDWTEEVRAVRDLYDLKQARFGKQASKQSRADVLTLLDSAAGASYTMQDAADELDRGKGTVAVDIQLARALDEYPDLAREQTKTAAWKRYRRLKETSIRAEQARRTNIEALTPHHVDAADTALPPPAPKPGEEGTIRQPIRKIGWKGAGMLYLADARDVLRLMQPGSVDLIVTDPPYGLGMFKSGTATTGQRLAEHAGTMYDDDPHKIMDMLDEVFMHCARVLKPQAHAYIFFHMTRYEEVYVMLRKHFGSCEETPLIWVKNTPGIGDPNQTWVYSYEPCFWINRGRSLVKPQAFNYLRYDTIPPSQKVHPTQKPAALLRHLIQASAVEGEVVLDPFAGSGSTLVAAHKVGCRFVGIEREESFHRSATDFISQELAANVDNSTSERIA